MTDDELDLLLAAAQTRPLPTLVPRTLHVPEIPRKAVTLIGMRRSGKTYALYDRMQRLVAAGVPREHILYLNLEDDRLGQPDVALLDRALERFYRRTPAARRGTAHLFFDEIQVVPDWERFLRRVIDSEDVRVIATGSSARLLSTEVATSFRGRGIAVEVLPFGLEEAARAAGVASGAALEASWPPAPEARSALEAFADAYLERGGFPEVQVVHPFDRVQVLQDHVDLVLLKDVAERHGLTNLVALRALVRAVFAANANPFSVSKLHGTLVSQGVKVAKPTLLAYLGHLVDAFLVFLVPIRTRSAKQRLVNPRKVYAVDTGLASVMRAPGARDVGALLENLVYLELRRRLGRLAGGAITYYRTQSGREVDFAVDPVLPGEPPALIQVCATLRDAVTREREVRALAEGMAETNVAEGTIVTLADREDIQVDRGPMGTGRIRVVPAWWWALAPQGGANVSEHRRS